LIAFFASWFTRYEFICQFSAGTFVNKDLGWFCKMVIATCRNCCGRWWFDIKHQVSLLVMRFHCMLPWCDCRPLKQLQHVADSAHSVTVGMAWLL
jgi:hypothetical protein